jgi:hypothetical protein
MGPLLLAYIVHTQRQLGEALSLLQSLMGWQHKPILNIGLWLARSFLVGSRVSSVDTGKKTLHVCHHYQ